jgi:hypothetical protein
VTFRSGPSAARRLLQPPQSASTPARSSDPRLVQPERALARSARRPRFREARRPYRHARPKPRVMMTAPAPSSGGNPSPARRRPLQGTLARPPGSACAEPARTVASRVFTGQERPSVRGAPLVRASSLRATGGECFPNPIRSDTSRRGTAASPAGDSGVAPVGGRSRASPGQEGRPRSGCSFGDPTQGRAFRSSAKRLGIRRTRGAFHR